MKYNLVQVANVLFLREMLSHQNNFAKHYAEGLDGCGLDLESRVRRSYYALVRRLVDSVRDAKRMDLSR